MSVDSGSNRSDYIASIKHYYCVRERENSFVVKINENKRRRWAGREIEVIRLPNLFWPSKVLCGKVSSDYCRRPNSEYSKGVCFYGDCHLMPRESPTI